MSKQANRETSKMADANKFSASAKRNQHGSILIIGIVGMGLICAIVLLLSIHLQSFLLQRQKGESGVQAAALAVAGDLSRIVVKDSHWGYVSLCDHPAAGKATLSADGEPLPITGVNTMLAGVRLEKLIAANLQNDELDYLAAQDISLTRQSASKLQQTLDAAVKPPAVAQSFQDINGAVLTPYLHARQQFLQNVPEIANGRAELIDLKISLGWLTDGSTTMTLDPQRQAGLQTRKYYPAFENVPLGKDDFYFAGLSEQPRLIDTQRFKQNDGKRFRSAVLVEATIAYFSPERKKLYEVTSRAAALPYGNIDKVAFGSLALFLPQGKVKEASRIRDLIEIPGTRNRQVSVATASGGDYPLQPKAQLVGCQTKQPLSLCVGRALFDWLRTTRARVRLDSVLEVVNTPFDQKADGCGTVLLYDFDRKGTCVLKTYKDGGFLTHTVSESQSYVMATNIAETEKGMLGLTIRNQVANIGEADSGQHGGQPIPGELPVDYACPAAEEPSVSPGLLRKSSKQGGLAVCIQLFVTPKT